MKRMRLTTAKKAGFARKHLRIRKDLPKQTIGYMKQKSSFIVAAFSLVAFISGNMMGQHGWYAFWKAALGQYDDTLITYTGTVSPIALVPDYTRWSAYGGNGEEHTFRQVPKDLLIPLPPYNSATEKKDFDHAPEGDVYSIGHMGSYETGSEGDGSHIGVDIRVPQGTPIRAIANGVVTRVANDASGFGLLIVIRHPHMPDPDNPQYETVLHSSYAHLSAQFVKEGETVQKGQEIGLSGKTGFATGPHLHFQIDRDTAPWHPYWAFSYTEANAAGMNTAQAINAGLHKERGYEYSVNPLLLVQANYPAAKYKMDAPAIAKNTDSKTPSKTTRTTAMTTAQRRAQRVAKLGTTPTTTVAVATVSSSARSSTPANPVVKTQTVVATTDPVPTKESAPVLVVPQSTATVATIDIQHDRQYTGREWESVRLTLLDASGNRVSGSVLEKDIYMRTAYGEAEFNPPVLSGLDFENGVATVKMLPRGTRTVVIMIEPYKVMSKPMEHIK